MSEIEVGTFWRLKSGNLVRIEHGGRSNRFECIYVDEHGVRLYPYHASQVTLSRSFLESYGRRVTLDAAR